MGGFVNVQQQPAADSVQEYIKYLKYNAPNKNAEAITRSPDIECPCCTQQAPREAAALLQVEDQTPFTQKFGTQEAFHNNKLGETMWLCADCYTNGVRPKYIYFGEPKWNKMGLKVQKRAEKKGRHPW